MKNHIYILLTLLFLLSACNHKFVISDVDYSQDIESVLIPDETGTISDLRHGISFNIRKLEINEFGDSTKHVDEIRMIRDKQGYYFITAPLFKHVYIFKTSSSELKLHKKLYIDNKLELPVFNNRAPYIELVDINSDSVYYLNNKGLKTGGKS